MSTKHEHHHHVTLEQKIEHVTSKLKELVHEADLVFLETPPFIASGWDKHVPGPTKTPFDDGRRYYFAFTLGEK